MTTQRRTVVRTPKRRKMWCVRSTFLDITTNSQWADDILDPAFTALGLSNMGGLTVMRILGTLQLVSGSTPQPSSTTWSEIDLGICWINSSVNISGGSGSIPQAWQNGLLEAVWLQQWELGAFEQQATSEVFAPLMPIETSLVKFDVTQMRKQPTADSKLVLTGNGGTAWTQDAVALKVSLQTLVALP